MVTWCRYCIMQLITVLESNLHLYYKKGKVGNDPNAEERLEEREMLLKSLAVSLRNSLEMSSSHGKEKRSLRKATQFLPNRHGTKCLYFAISQYIYIYIGDFMLDGEFCFI